MYANQSLHLTRGAGAPLAGALSLCVNKMKVCLVAESSFWKLFDLLRKVIGLAFLVGGFALGSYLLVSVFGAGEPVNVNGVPNTDVGNKLFVVLLPYTVAVFGWLIMRAKPYYPSK